MSTRKKVVGGPSARPRRAPASPALPPPRTAARGPAVRPRARHAMHALTNCSNPHASCNPHAYVVPPPGPHQQPARPRSHSCWLHSSLVTAWWPHDQLIKDLYSARRWHWHVSFPPCGATAIGRTLRYGRMACSPILSFPGGASRRHTGNRTTSTCPSHMTHRTRRHHGLTYPWPQHDRVGSARTEFNSREFLL